MLSILPMEDKHIKAVHTIEQLCFSQPWSEAALNHELTNPLACFLVAEQNTKVVAYGGMHCIAGEAYVTNIATHPNEQRQGFGKAVTAALIKQADKQGMLSISLEVRTSNAAAIHLYLSLGFEQIGVRPRFYDHPKEDALIMTKYLNQV